MSPSTERRPGSGRIFLDAYTVPPPGVPEAEVDAWARAVAGAMIERYRQAGRSEAGQVPIVRERPTAGEVVEAIEERLPEPWEARG
jgi:hypothetical protein